MKFKPYMTSPFQKMAYTPSNSSPSLVASPDFSSPQAYWAQPGIDPASQDALSAYYPPLILQVAGVGGGVQLHCSLYEMVEVDCFG